MSREEDCVDKIPSANSTDNEYSRDVIGNKNDNIISGPGNSSLYGLAGFMSYYHIHSPSKVYPVLADPITVTASVNTWTDYGSWTELVPVNTIIEAFDIHWIHTGEISAQGNYVLQLASGTSGNEIVIGTIAFSRDSNQVQTATQPIQIPPQSANTRISVRLSSGNAVANTVDVKVYYHEYPIS